MCSLSFSFLGGVTVVPGTHGHDGRSWHPDVRNQRAVAWPKDAGKMCNGSDAVWQRVKSTNVVDFMAALVVSSLR